MAALLTGAKTPQETKTETFLTTLNRYRRRKCIRKDIGRVLSEKHLGGKWYLPNHQLLNPNNLCKVRRVCKAASKYKEVCRKEQLLAGPDLLHGLIGTKFGFRENP